MLIRFRPGYTTGTVGLSINSIYYTDDTTQTGDPIKIDGRGYLYSSSKAIIQRMPNATAEAIIGLSAHELGHSFFNFPDMDHSGNNTFSHYAQGQFCAMSGGGFNGVASLYSPVLRSNKGWTSANQITSNQTLTFSDFDLSGSVPYYSLPDYSHSSPPAVQTSSGQKLYLSYYSKPPSIRWQMNWPIPKSSSGDARGVLIWHARSGGSWFDRNNLPIDIESAHGKWDWVEDRADTISPPNNKQAIRSTTQDPLTGLDSLEVRYSYRWLRYDSTDIHGNPRYTEFGTYPDKRIGSATCFYDPLNPQKMTFYSNPNSNHTVTTGAPNSRSLVSGFRMDCLRLDGSTVKADVVIGATANTLTENVTLPKGVWRFISSVTVPTGKTLTLQPGTELYFYEGANIIVDGALTAEGTSSESIVFNFVDGSATGISVRNGGSANLEYCQVSNANIGITTSHTGTNTITLNNCTFEDITLYAVNAGTDNDIEIVGCTFDNCGSYCIKIAGSADSAPYIYNNTFTNSYGAISAVNINQVVFIVNNVEDSEIGVYGSNVTSFVVISNTFDSDQKSMPGVFFESCGGVIAGNMITGYTNGISLGNSSPYIGQNVVTYNLYHAMTIGSGSNPDMSGQTFYEGYNTFQNNGNSTTGTDGSEIYFGYNSNANMSRGCNSIIDDRCPPYTECNIQDYPVQLLMNSQGLLIPITVEAEYNYWGNSQYYDLEDRFGNLRVYYEPYYSSPCAYEELSGGENLYLTTSDGRIVDTTQVIATDSLSATETLYFEALENFLTADYESAETICNQIVNSDDTLFAKLSAYQMLYYIGNIESKPASYFTNLYNTFSELSQSTSDSLLIKMFTQLGSLSLIGKQEYTNAIEEFNDVIEQNPNTEESVFAEIDALTAGLLIENDTTLGKTNVGKYLVKSDEYQDRIKNILKKNFGVKQIIETTESIPKQYQLYQNYPNPFNPVTTIKYDIVKAQNVKVTIFDILGREVTTLVNTQQQPGTYTITWDASNAASGIYFYQLKTKDYVDTKKMILLK